MSDLPPLQAVRVFESVARHMNFTKAASELNMTQPAVSYQIKLLEAFVGASLFVRMARGVSLSEAGATIAPLVRRALGDLTQAFRQARDERSSVLVITTMHTLASSWLAPRIGNFQLAHPDIAVRLDVSSRVADLETESIDVAIRHGDGKWPGHVSHALLEGSFVVVCSPDYIMREGPLDTPEDLARRGVLISPGDPWWPLWFKAAGLPASVQIERPGIEVDTQQIATRLAAAGHGIALVHPGFVREELASNRLIQLFDVIGSTGSSYHLLYPEGRRSSRKIRLFRDWLLGEAGRTLPAAS